MPRGIIYSGGWGGWTVKTYDTFTWTAKTYGTFTWTATGSVRIGDYYVEEDPVADDGTISPE